MPLHRQQVILNVLEAETLDEILEEDPPGSTQNLDTHRLLL
jgi:hypothetical protein